MARRKQTSDARTLASLLQAAAMVWRGEARKHHTEALKALDRASVADKAASALLGGGKKANKWGPKIVRHKRKRKTRSDKGKPRKNKKK